MPPEFDEEFDEFDEELMDCPECQGEGQVECMACDGTGDDEFDEMCDECGGMGEAFCDACDGDGQITAGEVGPEPAAAGMMNTLPPPTTEGFTFDRFMDNIIIKEGASNTKVKTLADSPQRVRARKHQERPLGRIRFGVK